MTAVAFDFWNNPIVVSAFRVKYRRGTFNATAVYLLALAVGGAVLQHYQDKLWTDWAHVYFIALIGLQFVVSALVAVSSTSAAMRSEVVGRTLDFQRIAALTPRQILLGKMLGESAQAFLLAIATIPLGVFCWLWGGVGLDALVLLYVQVMTTTVFFGALGLVSRLEPAGKSSGTRGPEWMVFAYVIGLFMVVPGVLAAGPRALHVPGLGPLLGLLTPLPSYYGMIHHEFWGYYLSFFELRIPYQVVTPLAQLALAAVIFRAMERQLVNPLRPPLGKAMAYGLLAAVDVVTAASLFESVTVTAFTLAHRAAVFCLVHFLVSLALAAGMTPWRETVHSWVWRFRGRRNALADAWLGDRSPTALALLTFVAIGVIDLGLLVLLPHAYAEARGAHSGGAFPTAAEVLARLRPALPPAAAAAAVMAVLTLAYGTLHQMMLFLAGRAGSLTMMTVALLAISAPHIAGYYYDLPWLERLSPSYLFYRWMAGPTPFAESVPLLVLYGGAWLALWGCLRRLLYTLDRSVRRKLERMGALGTDRGALVPEPRAAVGLGSGPRPGV